MLVWLQALGACVAVAALAFLLLMHVHRRKYKTIPGPPSAFFTGDLGLLLKENTGAGGRLRSILDMVLRYGKAEGICRLHVGPLTTRVFITDPELVKEMMVSKREDWKVGPRDDLRRTTGEGLLVVNGEYWKFQRELLNPMFHHPVLAPMASTIVERASVLLRRLQEAAVLNATVDFHSCCMQLTLDIIGRTAFGLDFAAQTDAPSTVSTVLASVLGGKAKPSALSVVRQELLPVIRARMAAVASGGPVAQDLLTQLVAARDPKTNAGMNEDQIMAEVMTFLFAGHDTTANLVAWFSVAMCDNPSIAATLSRELDAAFGDAKDFDAVDASLIPPYLDDCIKETLRFHSPVPMFGRVPANGDGVLGGKYHIPKDTLVIAASWVIHHHPDLWKDPESFDPTRFDGSAHGHSASPFSYIPFSCGPRRCIGSNFALLEARIILTQIYRHFRFEKVGQETVSIGAVRRPVGLKLRVFARA